MRENCVNINMNKLIIILYFCFFIALQGYSQSTSNIDAIPPEAVSDLSINAVDTIAMPRWTISFGDCAELTVDNLYKALDKYDVKFKKIVVAQAILETGHFSSVLCVQSHNIFGLRHPSDGSYYVFNNWEESVKAYKDDVQYKYTGGDYYAFLTNIGYAQDPQYARKVMQIACTL